MTVQDGPRRDNRFMMWAGHYSIRAMIPAIGVVILFAAAGRPGGDNGILSWVVSAVWLAWFATVILDYNYHEARLCERCITSTPLDPQAAIKRWDRALRFFHAKRKLVSITIVITIWFFAGSTFFRHQWWSYAISVIAYILIAVLFVSLHQHRRLYPWCPYCKWGDGGQPEVVPDPDPAASVS